MSNDEARYEELCSIEEPTEAELLEAVELYERLYPSVDHSY